MFTLFDEIITLLSCLLSVIGTTYVIVNYLMNPILQNPAFKLVYNLSISNFIWTMSNLFNIVREVALSIPEIMQNPIACQGLGAFKLFSHLSGLLWTANISKRLYLSIFFKPQHNYEIEHDLNRSFRKTQYVCYGLPALSSITLWLSGDYGHVYPFYEYNCFVGQDDAEPEQWLRSLLVRLTFYYLPIWILFIYITTLIVKIIVFLIRNLQSNMDKSFLYKLILFPVLVLICWIPTSIKNILSDFHIIDAEYFSVFDFVLMSLCGFLNSLVYSYHTLLEENSLLQIIKAGSCYIWMKKLVRRDNNFDEMLDESMSEIKKSELRIKNSSQSINSSKEIEIIGNAGIFRESEFQKTLNSQLRMQF